MLSGKRGAGRGVAPTENEFCPVCMSLNEGTCSNEYRLDFRLDDPPGEAAMSYAGTATIRSRDIVYPNLILTP
jgi:hypothetical protein